MRDDAFHFFAPSIVEWVELEKRVGRIGGFLQSPICLLRRSHRQYVSVLIHFNEGRVKRHPFAGRCFAKHIRVVQVPHNPDMNHRMTHSGIIAIR